MKRRVSIPAIGFGIVLALLLAAVGGYIYWSQSFISGLSLSPLAERVAAVPASAGKAERSPTSKLVEALFGVDVLIVGASPEEERHGDMLATLLVEAEHSRPWHVAVVGLDVSSRFQSLIDAYLESGDDAPMLASKDQNLTNASTQNVLQAVHAINLGRTPKTAMKVVAMLPPADSDLEGAELVESREKIIAEALMPALTAAKLEERVSIIFTGMERVQRSGSTVAGVPPLEKTITWLGTRLATKFKVLAVAQNNPTDTCDDVIASFLKKRGDRSPALIDLRNDALGDVVDVHCTETVLAPLPFRHEPKGSKARDHYDFYWYYPPRRS